MKYKLMFYILTFGIVLLFACGTGKHNETTNNKTDQVSKSKTFQKDTVEIKETFNEEDCPINESLTDRLKPIRANFKKINAITSWASTNKKDLWDTTEGGEATFYYLNGQLEKIVTRRFGEMFQRLTEYYLLSGQLSFVFEKLYKYNRPIYYDSTAMKENNDRETFDFEKSEIIENRSSFEKGKLIYRLNNQDCSSPFTDDYLLEEQKRIKIDFGKLIKLDK